MSKDDIWQVVATALIIPVVPISVIVALSAICNHRDRIAALWTRNLARIKVGAVVVASLAAFPFVVKALVQGLTLLGYLVECTGMFDRVGNDLEAFGAGACFVLLVFLASTLVACLVCALRGIGLTPIAWLRSKAEAEERERLRAAQVWAEAREAEIREQRAIDEERQRLERLERRDRERMEALQEQAQAAVAQDMTVYKSPEVRVQTVGALPIAVEVELWGCTGTGWARYASYVGPSNAPWDHEEPLLGLGGVRVVLKPRGDAPQRALTVPADALCPVCKAQVLDGCAIVFCGACRLVHHEECAAGHKCAAYGCGAELKSGDVAFCDAPAFLCTCVCGCKAPVHVIGRCLECVRGEKCP